MPVCRRGEGCAIVVRETLDLSQFSYDRLARNEPILELNVV
jgi:hypothetical protein